MREDSALTDKAWRQSYEHVFQLPGAGCAWEFLRRDPELMEGFTRLKPDWQEREGDSSVKIVQLLQDEAADCLWSTSPDQDANSATVIWNSATTAHALKVVALPPRLAFGGQVLDLDFITVEKTLLTTPAGTQQLLFCDGPRSLPLNVKGASVTEPVALFVDTAIPEGQAEHKLRLLRCLRALRETGELLPEFFPPHPYTKRAATVLLALDGYLAGMSHRDIAIAMVGEERVAREWSDASENLRDAVRRAIVRGVALMKGGYRTFLR